MKSTNRAVSALVVAALTVTMLSGCAILLPAVGERSLDTSAIADAVTETSASISSTTVETSKDGFSIRLFVRPVITSEGFTSTELDAVLEAAYEGSRGVVQSIEVRTVRADEEPVDVKTAASGLGIYYIDKMNSVTYWTKDLDERYGD